jgi:hypothetical protein
MTTIRIAAGACLLFLTASQPAWPQAKPPDLSGHWVMDASNSTYGGMALPKSYVETIESKDATLSISTASEDQRGEQKYLTKLTTDGRDNLNVINGNEFHSKSHWEGGKLVTTVTGDRGLTLVEVRSLSSDGKTQTVETYMGHAGATPQMKRVMRKSR